MSINDKTTEEIIDYRECEKEPIATLGTIQSYGGLIVIRGGEVIAFSKNIRSFLPIDSNNCLHKKVSEVSPELYQLHSMVVPQVTLGKTFFKDFGPWIVGFRREENELFYVEFFPQPTHLFDLQGLELEIDQMGRKFHYPTKDRAEFLNEICHIFQKYLRLDQVFVQALNEGEIIEVIAEANNGKIEPVLGLHFSSKEIPSQARDLYLVQLIRFKQAALEAPVEIVSEESVNLTHSFLREPSKFMTVYMQNILASTLVSASIVIDKKLSALLTMHNSTPLLLDPRSFERIVELVRKVSLELFRVDDLIKKNADSKLWELLKQDFPLNRLAAIEKLISTPTLKKALEHTGAVVVKDGKSVTKVGECPMGECLEALIQKTAHWNGSMNFSSELTKDFDLSATLLGDFAGVMRIRFEEISVLFFRKSFQSELKWRSATPESFENDSHLPRFSPAGSFRFFIEEFKNQSRPWTEKDVAFGHVLAQWISEDFES